MVQGPYVKAFEDRFAAFTGAHHAVAARRILDHLDFLDATLAALTEQINALVGLLQPPVDAATPAAEGSTAAPPGVLALPAPGMSHHG